jgi:type IV pilus assembly protein PilQ
MKHRLASEVGKFILQEKMSRDGAVYSDDSINTLYFCDVPSQVVDAQTSLPDWDTPPDMVRIEVQIVELECDDDFNFGLDLNAWKEGLPESVDLNFDIRNSKNNSQAVAIGNPDGTARYFATTLNLNGMRPKAVANFINYMCVKGKAKVISRPVIVARNGQSATISSVDKISYMAYSAATAPLTQQAEVGITVNIKPIIGSETVTLNIQASVNSLMGFSQSSAPLINTRNTLADVVLKNGELFTLSGLRKDTITKMDQRVPFFGYIPLLGYFFRQEIDAKKTYEIVVLLTPEKVTPTTGSTAKEKEALAKIKEEIEKEKEDKNFFVEKFILNENP